MSSMERVSTDKVRSYSDLVNLLRSVNHEVALPAVAVIGDQGSGKNSVLETLSGVTLDRERNYTLVLQMNKAKGDNWNGSVHKASSWNKLCIQNRMDAQSLIYKCRTVYSGAPAITNDVIILEISSPDVPNLTLIDLPSIPFAQGNNTSRRDQVKGKIKEIITNPAVIVLMVIPCSVEIKTTEAFKLAQKVDPDGQRTLGLLTKPDVVNKVKGQTVVDIVQNKVINLKRGFMIVRSFDQRKMSLMDPKETEIEFFKEHALFKSLYDGGFATVPKLSERLSQELAQHTEKYLPQLKEYVKKELWKADEAIKRFGKLPPSDSTGADTLPFLTEKLNIFMQKVMSLTTGELLDLTEQRAFGVWRKSVKDSEESFQRKVKTKVALHEQSRFSDFQTVIRDHITLLEEPAVYTVCSSADIVKTEVLKLMESTFYGFQNFISKAMGVISEVTASNQKAAESMVRTLFKMEHFEVCAEGRKYINKNTEKESSRTALLDSYYQTVCQRLTAQIPMIIHFHIIKESTTELQKMMQILDCPYSLHYDKNLTTKADRIQKGFIPLTKAQSMLSEL